MEFFAHDTSKTEPYPLYFCPKFYIAILRTSLKDLSSQGLLPDILRWKLEICAWSKMKNSERCISPVLEVIRGRTESKIERQLKSDWDSRILCTRYKQNWTIVSSLILEFCAHHSKTCLYRGYCLINESENFLLNL